VDPTGLPQFTLEISPLFGYDEESFVQSWSRLNPKPAIADGLFLEPTNP
jgi:UDP-N-acetylglucosamine/UDP-N-acetylgalactosamine diphosphorylase